MPMPRASAAGGTLVTVRADDSMAAQAADILDDHGTIDLDERQSSWRNEGWSGTYNPDDATGANTSVGASTGARPADVGTTTGSDMDERRPRVRIHGSNPGL